MGDTDLVVDYLVGRDEVTERMSQLEGQVTKIAQLTAKGLIPQDIAKSRIKDFKTQFGDLGGAIDRSFKRGISSAGQFDARLLSLLFSSVF